MQSWNISCLKTFTKWHSLQIAKEYNPREFSCCDCHHSSYFAVNKFSLLANTLMVGFIFLRVGLFDSGRRLSLEISFPFYFHSHSTSFAYLPTSFHPLPAPKKPFFFFNRPNWTVIKNYGQTEVEKDLLNLPLLPNKLGPQEATSKRNKITQFNLPWRNLWLIYQLKFMMRNVRSSKLYIPL